MRGWGILLEGEGKRKKRLEIGRREKGVDRYAQITRSPAATQHAAVAAYFLSIFGALFLC